MRKRAKLTYLINFVLVLMLAGNASAADKEWTGAGDPNLWRVADNWDPAVVPSSDDSVEINLPDVNCLIDPCTTAECDTLTVGYDAGTCYLDMNGGSLETTGNLIIGEDPDGSAVFRMSGGTVTLGSSGRFQIAYGVSDTEKNPTYGTLIMTGGVITVGYKLELAKNQTAVGNIYMYDGTLDLTGGSSTDFEFAVHGTGNLYMYGGDVNCAVDKLRLGGETGDITTGVGTIYMEDGNIICNDLIMDSGNGSTIYLDGGLLTITNEISMAQDDARMEITDGTLILEDSDFVDTLYQYLYDKIVPGAGYVLVVVPEGGGIGYTTVTAELGDPNLAWDQKPDKYVLQWTPDGLVLTWKPAPSGNADSHDVYFGNDYGDVNDANNSDPCGPDEIYKGNQDANNYPTVGVLDINIGQTYYWRIDEVNEGHGDSPWKGNIWQFMVADFVDVEDFDSYTNQTALKTVWSLTGSDIDVEGTIARSGNSMKYEYDNDPANYTEADANITGPNSLDVATQNWTLGGIKALVLYFHGATENEAEPMYVALRDTDGDLATVYYDDPNDLNEPEWHEWNIELSEFDTNNVNLTSIETLYIGFGYRGNPTAGGEGTVYFDDIRLYPTRCVASFAPKGDIDSDCDVDFEDVNVMAFDWLDTDSIRAGSDGDVNGGTWTTGHPEWDGGLQLDGDANWVDLDDTDFSNFRNKTIAFWVKVLDYPPSDYRHLFCFKNLDEEVPYRIYFMTRTEDVVRVRFVEDYSADFKAYDEWSHVSLVIEDTDDGLCKGTFRGIRDGQNVFNKISEMEGRPRHSGGASGVNIGSEDDGVGGFANMIIDDFRVYDRALTGTELLALAKDDTPPDANMLLYYDFDEGEGSVVENSSTYEFYHPLLSDAELYDSEAEGSRVVDFKDFAILANDWLEEKLWP